MKRICPFFVSMICIVLVAAASASDTIAGLRFTFSGGPMLSLVVDQRLSQDMRVNFAVGGFPGIILGVEANIRIAPKKRKAIIYGGGMGWRRFYRGRGDGKSLKLFQGFVGYQFESPAKWLYSGDVGLVYVPRSLNRWMDDLFDNDSIPIVPYLSVETLYEFK